MDCRWTESSRSPLADVQAAIDRIMANTGYDGPTQDQLNAANAEIERLAGIVGPDAAIAAVERATRMIHGG